MDITLVNAISLQFFFLTFGCTGASAQLRMTPENKAGVVGSSVVLQCQGSVNDPLGGIFWNEYITTTSTSTPIVYNGNPVNGTPNSQLYSITGDSSLAQYHLNIELAFLSGGRYECAQFLQGRTASSHVTVLESAPVCNTIPEDGIVEEGETITYTCEVAYNSTTIDWPPVMTWTGPNGTVTDVNKLSTSGGTVTSSVDVTGAPGLNGAVYSVRTHFEAYGGSLPDNYATNVPIYSHTHNFNALQVHYSPRDIAFQPGETTFEPGDRLTCSAVGNPAVSYKWYKSPSNSTLADGAELTIREEMDGLTCGCEAYNTIQGTKHSISKEITLTVNQATEPTTTEAPTLCICSGPSPGVVAGIVIAVILLLGLLVVSSLLLWRTRNTSCEKCKEMLNQPHPAKSNGCNGVYETPNTSGITGQSSEYTELSFT